MVELPWAVDSCPCVEELRTVLPFVLVSETTSGGGLGCAQETAATLTAAVRGGYVLGVRKVVVHVHADQEAARVRRLVALLDPKTGEVSKQRPRAVGTRQMALVELETIVRTPYPAPPILPTGEGLKAEHSTRRRVSSRCETHTHTHAPTQTHTR